MRHIEPINFQCTVAQHQGSFQGLYPFVEASPFSSAVSRYEILAWPEQFYSRFLVAVAQGFARWSRNLGNFAEFYDSTSYSSLHKSLWCAVVRGGHTHSKALGRSHYPGPMKILVIFHQIRELSSSFYHLPFLQKFRNCITDLIFG